MPPWILKSVVHRGISWLPSSQSWNYFLQRYITKSLAVSYESFELKTRRAHKMLTDFRTHCQCSTPTPVVLELGTGWYPVLPVVFFLCGAERISTIDKVSLLRTEQVRAVCRFFCEHDLRGSLTALLPSLQPRRLATLHELLKSNNLSVAEMLAALNIEALVRDQPQLDLPDGMAHLICSEVVLTYISPSMLVQIFREFRRLAFPGGMMIHSIAMRDDYAHFDPRISVLNMLKYSPAAWRWLDSPIAPNNRLRISDYRKLHHTSGFDIVAEENITITPDELRRVPIHEDFTRYSFADLLVTDTWMISRPAEEGSSGYVSS